MCMHDIQPYRFSILVVRNGFCIAKKMLTVKSTKCLLWHSKYFVGYRILFHEVVVLLVNCHVYFTMVGATTGLLPCIVLIIGFCTICCKA